MLVNRAGTLLFLLIFFFTASSIIAVEKVEFNDAWGSHGLSLESYSSREVKLNYSIQELQLLVEESDGDKIHNLLLPGVFLPNEEGAPNLPTVSHYIAIPQGAEVELKVISSRTEELQNLNISPATRIPAGADDDPLEAIPDMAIYSRDEYYPANPIIISEPTRIRGLDVVIISITPFQYNPVSQELRIYRDLKLEVDFIGGNGHFGEDRLRSKWFDPILYDLVINPRMIPTMDYSSRDFHELDGYEYLIVVPDDPAFIAWGDTIREFRSMQGIKSDLVTISEIGSNNHTQIKNYIQNNYINDDIPPVAVLFLADYGTSGNTITSQLRTDHPYPYTSSYITDNYYADMTGNELPDIITARITARNAAELELMINKFIDYETNPPSNPNFYLNPVTAMGWQTERWFQLCAETVSGFWEHGLGKQPARHNAIYQGTPSGTWSTATNTGTVLNVFGPNGMGYLEATPDYLNQYGWSANATTINNSINSGAFMLLHRDHGFETGWGEPDYNNNNAYSLVNEDLTFVFSINCLTGKFNITGDCLVEAFHRHTYGALGVVAPTEVSYSFVNDTLVWGMFNNMWPSFLPDTPAYETEFGTRYVMPAFAMAAGKWFLQGSSWPYNNDSKIITHRLFHHHGDPFTNVCTDLPEPITASYNPVLITGTESFFITAEENSLISLSVNGEIIGTALATGEYQEIEIEPQYPPDIVDLVITKQNRIRYHSSFPIIVVEGSYITCNPQVLDIKGVQGETTISNMTINNFGSSTLNFNFWTAENWISFNQLFGQVQSMENTNAGIIFDATSMETGVYEAEVLIYHNTSNLETITIPVTFTVVIPELVVDPQQINFGEVEILNPVVVDFELSNLVEVGDIEISDISLLGDNDDEFELISPPVPFLISDEETVSLTVTFVPLVPGEKNVILRLVNDTDDDIIDITISATSIPEVIGQPVGLAHTVFNFNNVELDWSISWNREDGPGFDDTPFSSYGGEDLNSTRGLQGYNVHRNDDIIAELISATEFTDYQVPNGTYTYQVEAVFFTTSTWSNTVEVTIDADGPISLPFSENWSSSSFASNNWSADNNWSVHTNVGNPAPSARFYWSPTVTNYERSLTSWGINATTYSEVTAQFDIYLSNYSATGQEWLSFEVHDGIEWQSLQSWNNTGSIGWTTVSFDISEYVAQRVFPIRFRAYGANSYNINNWNIDNIYITGEQLVALDPPSVTSEVIAGQIHLNWDDINGANSYRIYRTDNPYPEESDWVEIAIVSEPGYAEEATSEMRFYRVIASTDHDILPMSGTPEIGRSENNNSIRE